MFCPAILSCRNLQAQGSQYHFVEDPSTVGGYGGYTRGWSNQLVAYNRTTNRWVEEPGC